MKNSKKTREQLLTEADLLRVKISELEKYETNHQQIENALKESEEKFRILYESSRDAIMTLAPPTWRFTARIRQQ